MELIEKESFYIFSGPPKFLTAGFSRKLVRGVLPDDTKKIASFLGSSIKTAYLNQKHSSCINFVNREGAYEGDGLFSKKSGLALLVKTADCLPLFFYSVDLGVVGIVHMGWRSAKKGILSNIDFDLSSFKVIAGAGLRSCCYEVGKEFLGYFRIKDSIKKRDGRLYFNPVNFAKESLIKRGLNENNFFDTGICSFCSGKDVYSYRLDTTSFRTVSFILIS